MRSKDAQKQLARTSLKGKSSFQECKINCIENLTYEEPFILLTSDQISLVIRGDPNSFLSMFSEVIALS